MTFVEEDEGKNKTKGEEREEGKELEEEWEENAYKKIVNMNFIEEDRGRQEKEILKIRAKGGRREGKGRIGRTRNMKEK